MKELEEKHPPASDASYDALLNGPIGKISDLSYSFLDEKAILESAMRTNGTAGPSGMDADVWKKVLCSSNFKLVGKELREELAIFAKNLMSKKFDSILLESYTSCKLIALNKNPGVRPIGIGEAIRRIIGKAIVFGLKSDLKEFSSPLQVSAGYEAGAEAAIHSMKAIYDDKNTEGVILVDAHNAFNSMNRKVALHNVQILCPIISNYLQNTYGSEARLFLNGKFELTSFEGTTQGDPLAMPWFSINSLVMIDQLSILETGVKQVWLADDASAGGSLDSLLSWYDNLIKIGKRYGYNINMDKSWLILKSSETYDKAMKVFGQTIQITTEGKRHLGAVIGTQSYKNKYCNKMVNQWINELEVLCEFATIEPHAAYTAFTKGYYSKFIYFMRTIDGFGTYMQPIEELLSTKFLPRLFGTRC